jgi:hypothetical protein
MRCSGLLPTLMYRPSARSSFFLVFSRAINIILQVNANTSWSHHMTGSGLFLPPITNHRRSILTSVAVPDLNPDPDPPDPRVFGPPGSESGDIDPDPSNIKQK